jgi:adenine/guanine phosphoribosyltransferase-like PRPP-binding protein
VAESNDLQQPSHNPGTIEAIDGWPGWVWRTHVGPFELKLHIVSLGQPEMGGPEIGIASFVVMEQEQPFLDYAAGLLAAEIARHTSGSKRVILVTVESKGSHFTPWVWHNLAEIAGERLHPRIVTLRKGPKVYMKTPGMLDPLVSVGDQQLILSPVSFYSITSSEEQRVVISPKDADLLYEALDAGVEPVLVDDFLGGGGTVVGVHRLFERLNRQLDASGLKRLTAPRLVAVVGSDGNLFEQAFAEAQIEVTPLPQPFPLRLPTFTRENPHTSWKVRR